MIKRLLFFSCGLLLLLSPARPQNAMLGIGASGTIFNFDSTVNVGQSVSYYVWLKNYSSNVSFQNTVTFYTAVDTSMGFQLAGADTLFVSLNAGDSTPITLTEQYNLGTYRIGGNIIIIWPSGISAITVDSTLPHNVYVQPSSVDELVSNNNLTLFYNPISSLLTINNNSNRIFVDEVRIFDPFGRLTGTFRKTLTIDLGSLADGIYFLEVALSNHDRKAFKIIKQSH